MGGKRVFFCSMPRHVRYLKDHEFPTVIATPNGPYIVSANIPIVRCKVVLDENDRPYTYGEETPVNLPEGIGDTVALCRCGASKNKPFCDGSHQHINFDGAITAKPVPYDSVAKLRTDNGITLGDAVPLWLARRFLRASHHRRVAHDSR